MSPRGARTRVRVVLVGGAVFAAACGDLPDPGYRVTRNRVLAVRTELAADAAQSRPAPGEAFAARPLVASPLPEPPGGARWLLEVCAAGPDGGLVPVCHTPPFARGEGDAADPEARLVATAPAREALHPDVDALLLRGVLCTDGVPEPSPALDTLPTCAPGAVDEEAFFAYARVRDPDDPYGRNVAPSLAAVPITLDGVPWPPLDAPVAPTGCAEAAGTDALPRLDPDETREIALAFDPLRREPVDDEGTREILQLSHLVTAGDLGRFFSVLEGPVPQSAVERVEVDVTAPEDDVAPDGTLVRLTFVARDGRGGVDWTERHYCAAP